MWNASAILRSSAYAAGGILATTISRTCRILAKSFRQVLVAKMRMPGSLVSSSIAATSRHGAWGNAWSHVQQSASSPPRRCARASGTRRAFGFDIQSSYGMRGGTWTPKLQADRFAGFQHVRETGPLRRRAVEDIAPGIKNYMNARVYTEHWEAGENGARRT